MQSTTETDPAGTTAREAEVGRTRKAHDGSARSVWRFSRWSAQPSWLRRGIMFVAMVGVWEAYVALGHVSRLLFASPAAVAKAFVNGWSSGLLATSTVVTVEQLAIAMGIGIAVTLLFSAVAITSRFGDDLMSLLSSMINPLPSVAILPLAILWFGINSTSIILVTANAVLWPMMISVSMGFRTVPPTVVMVARNVGLRRGRLVRDVLFPAALPHVISGFKTGWAFGWRTIIAAELVFGVAGVHGGLGFFINNARYYLDVPDVFAGLVTIALIGIALDLVFSQLERRTVVRWGMKK